MLNFFATKSFFTKKRRIKKSMFDNEYFFLSGKYFELSKKEGQMVKLSLSYVSVEENANNRGPKKWKSIDQKRYALENKWKRLL